MSRRRARASALLLSLGLAGCSACTGEELFESAARSELRGVHGLGELGAPLVPPPQTYGLRKQDAAFLALRPHLSHPNPFHRLVALEATRRLATRARGLFRTRFPDLLDPLLSDPDPTLRWRAAWALGRLEWSRPGLLAAAGDRDPRVAERAVWALGRTRERAGIPAILPALERPAPLPERAVAALREITGLRLETPEAWRDWAARRPAEAAESEPGPDPRPVQAPKGSPPKGSPPKGS